MISRLTNIRDVLIYVALMWLVFFISFAIDQPYGIIPRSSEGLIGIITAPFFHGGIYHIVSNTIGLVTFGIIYTMLEGEDIHFPFWYITILGGALTWLFARHANHIGASGVIFGLYGYLISVGYLIKKIKYMIVSVIILLMYGWMIFGLFPSVLGNVSFEGHIFGFLVGISFARLRLYVNRKEKEMDV